MRLFTWNVNGVRSVRTKGFEDWFRKENPDIVCLQEIKAHPEQLAPEVVNPAGYHSVWLPAEKPGYSGVAVFSKKEPVGIKNGMGIAEFDREGRALVLDFEKFVLVNAYFPNSQREHLRLPYKLEFCKAMRKLLDSYVAKGRHVILCGDFNIAHKEIDLKNPKQNQNNAGFLPQERAWMDEMTEAGYIDAFRAFEQGPEHYTWWSYRPGVRQKNIGWRLDYFLTNPQLKDQLEKVNHHPLVLGSDHCPVELQLRH